MVGCTATQRLAQLAFPTNQHLRASAHVSDSARGDGAAPHGSTATNSQPASRPPPSSVNTKRTARACLSTRLRLGVLCVAESVCVLLPGDLERRVKSDSDSLVNTASRDACSRLAWSRLATDSTRLASESPTSSRANICALSLAHVSDSARGDGAAPHGSTATNSQPASRPPPSSVNTKRTARACLSTRLRLGVLCVAESVCVLLPGDLERRVKSDSDSLVNTASRDACSRLAWSRLATDSTRLASESPTSSRANICALSLAHVSDSARGDGAASHGSSND